MVVAVGSRCAGGVSGGRELVPDSCERGLPAIGQCRMHDAPPAVECRRGVRPSSVWRVSLAARQLLASPRQSKKRRGSCHVHSVRRSAPSVCSERGESLGDAPRCDAHRGHADAVTAIANSRAHGRGAVARRVRASRRRRSRIEMICRALARHRTRTGQNHGQCITRVPDLCRGSGCDCHEDSRYHDLCQPLCDSSSPGPLPHEVP